MLRVFYFLFLTFMLNTTALAQMSLIDHIQKAERSLVEVKTIYVKTIRHRAVSFERNGAGIVIDPSGLVVTNTHTIINAPHIFVILRDGTKLEAQVAFVSVEYDFSFLKINPPHPLAAIAWADSSQIRLGEQIAAVGNSDYDNQSILSGCVVSLLQSRLSGTIEFIETDLNLYQGDSGGPILDGQGRLLGIVMAKAKHQDRTSLAIASDKIREQYLRWKQNM